MKIKDLLSEAGSVTSTTSGNIPAVVNPGMTNVGKNVASGKPGKMAKKGPKQWMPKSQKPGTNALDSNVGLMTGTPIKRV